MDSLFIDCGIAGIAGDMLVSALLNLSENYCDDLDKLNQIMNEILPIEPKINAILHSKDLFLGLRLEIEKEMSLSVDELYKIFDISKSILRDQYYKFVVNTLDILISSEKKIHNIEEVHLHELGTTDTVIDIISVAYLLQKYNIEYISHSSIILGSGSVKTSHGILPVPPPVTFEIMKNHNLKEKISTLDGEAATPTGIAILAGLSKTFTHPKEVEWEKVGIGFGTKEWADRANFLRVRLGNSSSNKDEISLLETNIDDLTGEHLGQIIETLLGSGALDVNYFPIFMKKNRPGYSLRILCKRIDEDKIAEIVMKHTGSLGIRINSIERHIGWRKIETKIVKLSVNDTTFEVNVPLKIGKYRRKIEFEFLRNLASEYNMSPLEIEELIWREIHRSEK